MKLRPLILLASTAFIPAPALAQSAAPAPSAQAPAAAVFVSQAASGNLFEIQASQLALEKSQNNRVREFAQKMVQDHTQASDQLKAAAQGQSVPNNPDQEHAQMLQQLGSTSGGDFDRRYVQLQLTGHEDTVRLFDQYAQAGDNPQLKQFAQQMLPDLRQHLQMVQQIRSQLPSAQTAQNQPGQASGMQTTAPSGSSNWMTQEQPGQWRASKLKGVNIYNNNESIGEVEELIVGPDGRVQAAVIGVGGFLGLGQHDVAVPFNEIQWVMEPRAGVAMNAAPPAATAPAGTAAPRTADATRPADPNAPTATGTTAASADRATRSSPDHGVLNMTKDQLKAAPEFHYAR